MPVTPAHPTRWGLMVAMLLLPGAASSLGSSLPAAHLGPEANGDNATAPQVAQTVDTPVPAESAGAGATDTSSLRRTYYRAAPRLDEAGNELTAIGDSAVFPNDRQSVRLLHRSEELIDEGRFAEATQSLGRLMQLDDDFFFRPDKKSPTHRSVRSEASRLLDGLPERGRQFYELQFGAEARNELEQALAAGDIEAVADTARRFFHTDAGFEASYLVALDHLDHGRPLLASLILERLRDSSRRARDWEPMLSVRLASSWAHGGELTRAMRVWREMAQQFGDVDVRVGDRTLHSDAALLRGNDFSGDDQGKSGHVDAFSWLAEVAEWSRSTATTSAEGWLVFRGSPDRNAGAEGGEILLRPRWRVRTNADPVLDEMLTQQQHTYEDVGLAALPAAHPLVVGDIVLTRTLTNLTAIDFLTGKRLWQSASGADAHEVDEMALAADTPSSLTLRQGLEQRVWNDVTFGTLASDGKLVFAIEDLSLAMTQRQAQLHRRRINPALWRSWDANPFNRLAAYDIHTGKLAWEVGGARSDALPLSDTFFLGPPLPLAGKLYVLAEHDGEIRLWVLDAQSGEADWSQLLVVVEADRSFSDSRRMVGLSPSYADGILVCPTASGAIVAIDLTKRGLLWGYQYTPRDPRQGDIWQRRIAGVVAHQGQPEEICRWIDGSITLADGRVIVAPIESAELHCLDLRSGTPLWTTAPPDASYVAGVAAGDVIVVGQHSAQAYDLESGSPAWGESGMIFPKNLSPTGRGFLHDGAYYLPTQQGGLARIEFAHGEPNIVTSPAEAPVLGNLVVHRGSIISATAHGVDRYLEVDTARRALEERLAAGSEDAERYALEGELLLNEGKLDEAVAALERGKDLGGGVRVERILLEALLLGFKTEFAQYRDRGDEIEKLIRQPGDRAIYYRLLATGLQREGDLVGALDAYLTFADSLDDLNLNAIDDISPDLSVRRDRWLQAGIAALLAEVDNDDQADLIEARIQAHYDAASQDGPNGLRRFISLFDGHRLANDARVVLTSGATTSKSPIENELMLRQLVKTGDEKHRAQALAQLAILYRALNRPEDALFCARTLASEHPNTVCYQEQTGRELAAEFESDTSIVASLRTTDEIWPPGCANVQETTPGGRTTSSATTLYHLSGHDTAYTLAQLEYNPSKRELIGHDPLGQIRWQRSLAKSAQPARSTHFSFATSLGHLALLTLGTDVYAVDTLGTAEEGSDDVLWQTTLVPRWPGAMQSQFFNVPAALQPWGGARPSVRGGLLHPLGIEGYVSESTVCFERQREIVALDPLNGSTYWSYDGFAPGSALFGDAQHLVVAPPDGQQAAVLRLADGQPLGNRRVPEAAERMSTVGAYILAWTPNTADPSVRLHLYDTWNETDVWSREVPEGARADLVGDDYVGVMDREGHFLLISILTGDAVIDTKVEAQPRMTRLCLLETPTHWIVAMETQPNQPVSQNRNIMRAAVPPSHIGASATVDGTVWAFDRHTHELAWSRDVQQAGLRLDQPSASPMLVFVTAIKDTAPAGNSQTYSYEVLCLDTRDGKVLYEEARQGRLATYDLTTHPERHSVEIVLAQTHGVTVTYQCDAAAKEPQAPETEGGKNTEADEPKPVEANATN